MGIYPHSADFKLSCLLSAKRIAYRACPICENDSVLVRCELPAFISFVAPKLRVYRCIQCQKIYWCCARS